MQPIVTVQHNDILFPVPESALASPPRSAEQDDNDPLELAFFALNQR